VIGQARKKEDALAGLERWKERHPEAATHLAVDDVLVDGMRGRSSLWWRVRVNLRHVPEDQRPEAEAPDPDYDAWANVKPEEVAAWREAQQLRRASRKKATDQ
jgi:bifunctional non-homologous end joining protein LigD